MSWKYRTQLWIFRIANLVVLGIISSLPMNSHQLGGRFHTFGVIAFCLICSIVTLAVSVHSIDKIKAQENLPTSVDLPQV